MYTYFINLDYSTYYRWYIRNRCAHFEVCLLIWFVYGIDGRSKFQICFLTEPVFLLTCATCSDLPGNKSTMTLHIPYTYTWHIHHTCEYRLQCSLYGHVLNIFEYIMYIYLITPYGLHVNKVRLKDNRELN